jgi:hypothetical protein
MSMTKKYEAQERRFNKGLRKSSRTARRLDAAIRRLYAIYDNSPLDLEEMASITEYVDRAPELRRALERQLTNLSRMVDATQTVKELANVLSGEISQFLDDEEYSLEK